VQRKERESLTNFIKGITFPLEATRVRESPRRHISPSTFSLFLHHFLPSVFPSFTTLYLYYHQPLDPLFVGLRSVTPTIDNDGIMIRATLTLIFVAFCAGQVRGQNCHLREMDLCAASLLVFTQGPQGVGTTEKDLDRQCSFIKETDTCIRNFTKNCMTEQQQQLANFMFDGTSKLQKDYCTPGSALRKGYLKHSACLNIVQKEQKPCIKDLQVSFEEVTSAKWNMRTGLACCAYRRVRTCTENLMKEKCGEGAIDFFTDLSQAMLGRLPELMCDEFTLDSPTCKQLPPPGSAPKGSRSTSILNRLLSAYTNM